MQYLFVAILLECRNEARYLIQNLVVKASHKLVLLRVLHPLYREVQTESLNKTVLHCSWLLLAKEVKFEGVHKGKVMLACYLQLAWK